MEQVAIARVELNKAFVCIGEVTARVVACESALDLHSLD